jgi:hypothetical protein
MPYTVKKVKGGFKACKKNNKKCFSNKPLTKKKAVKQIGAISSEEKRNKVKKESFDDLINQYLNHYLFENITPTVPPSPAEIAKLGQTIQKKKKQELAASTNPANIARLATELKKAGITSDSLA